MTHVPPTTVLDVAIPEVTRWRWHAILIILSGISVVMIARLLWGPTDDDNLHVHFHRQGYFLGAVIFCGLTVIHLVQRHNQGNRWSEILFFVIGYIMLMYFFWGDLRFGNSIYAPDEAQRDSVLGTVVWFPLLFIAPFLIWSLQVAIFLALGCYASQMVLWLYFAFSQDVSQLTLRQGDFMHLAISGLIVIVLSSFLRQMTFVSTRERVMTELAIKDHLTGLPNRLYIDAFLRQEFPQHIAEGRTMAIAMCDIDHFKKVNDSFSHLVGDEALTHFATLLRQHLPKPHVVGRYGGEEFVILCPDTDKLAAYALCEELRLQIAHYDWARVAEGLQVTSSFGVSDSQIGVRHSISFEDVLHDADRKLYQAKRAGRNQVCI